jgi:PAS domain S-box-containing protein
MPIKIAVPRASLRTRIIAWSFIPTIIILAVVALVTFYAYQQVTEDLVVGRNKELARLSASQLATDLGGYVDLLNSLARTSSLYSGVPLLQAAALKNASNRLVVFDGGVLALNQYGVVTAAEPERPDALGKDWSNRAYFRETVLSVKPVFSNIVGDGPAGAQAIAVAVPILDTQGSYHGTLVGMFRLGESSFSAFYGGIVRERIDDGGDAYIVDSNGRVIYHSNGGLIGSDLHAQPAVQHVLNREVDTLRTQNVQGADTLASFAPVPGTPWGLVTEQSWSGLLAAGQGYGQFLLLLLGLGIIVPVVVATIGVRRITDPVAKLIAAAQNVAGGNFGQKIEVRTGDELEELVTQFNRMSEELSESYATLKEREERLALVTERANDGIWDWNLITNDCYFSPRWKTMLGYTDQELPNRFETWRDLLHPDDTERAMAEVQMGQAGKKQIYELEHRLRHKDGSYRWVLARGITLRDADGKPYRMAGSHTDITERKQVQEELRLANQTLERRVEERTHELATLNAIGAVVNRSLDLHEILSDALDKTLQSINMEFGTAYQLEGNGDRSEEGLSLKPLVHRGLSERFTRRLQDLRFKGSAVEAASRTGEPLVWEVAGTGPQFGTSEALAKEGIRQVVSIPLVAKGKLNGALYLGTAATRTFSTEQLALLAAIGQQVGVAVENARLYDQAEQSAQVAERSRLARELHDSVTQSLYSITLYAEASARLLTAGQPREASEHLRELRDTAQEALREMRLLIFELRPAALEKGGLAAALQSRLDAVETRGGIRAELRVEGREQLNPAAQKELYHIALEALNNALKHAKPRRVQLWLRFEADSTDLEICDDGVGFEPGAARSGGGYGLSGMAERAQRIGGTLHVESSPVKGTRVSVRVGPRPAENGGET